MTDRYQFIPEFHFPKSAHQLPIRILPLQKFLDDALQMPEVWFVTNWQAVQWMRKPKTLNELKSFAPWSCKKQVSLSTYCLFIYLHVDIQLWGIFRPQLTAFLLESKDDRDMTLRLDCTMLS